MGQEIRRSQILMSSNGYFNLKLEFGGNLVLYMNGASIWSTNSKTGDRFVMQSDGNSVLYDINNKALFSTKTSNAKGIFVRNDGNLVVLDNSNKVVWSSNTIHSNLFNFASKFFWS